MADKSMKKEDPLRSVLRKGGYKATGPRLAVLRLFKKSKVPMSAQEIIEALRRDIDQATVYRTLKSLKEKGIIIQVDLRHNHAHYELADADDHHHIVCVRCGKIEDVRHHDARELQASVLRGSKHFAEIREHALEFYGVCKSCATKVEVPVS